jgi:hypothetical protein
MEDITVEIKKKIFIVATQHFVSLIAPPFKPKPD